MQTIQRVVSVALIAFAAIALVAPRAEASAAKINADVRASLDQFFRQTPGARELANNAAGVLVFPTVVKAGFGIGGEYGEGALLVGGRPVGYYNLVSASFGFQLGAQARTVIIMFMTPSALAGFNRTAGWKVGVDGSVTLITLGAGASIDTNQITSPVIGFVLDPTGLMYNLTLEGSKISRINPEGARLGPWLIPERQRATSELCHERTKRDHLQVRLCACLLLYLPHGAPPARFTASCNSSQLLTHPRRRAFSLAASQARVRNSLNVIGASESSAHSSIASQGASCFRYFALKQVPRMATTI